ncbi:MAG: dihydroneopterin aldolase [Verrucomicrobiota bacterium]
MNTVTLSRQKVSCFIGVPDEERASSQILEITTTFPITDLEKAAVSDDIEQSVDYESVFKEITTIATDHPRKLVETLAYDLSVGLIKRFHFDFVEIEIRKFILPETEAVVLKFRKTRDTD